MDQQTVDKAAKVIVSLGDALDELRVATAAADAKVRGAAEALREAEELKAQYTELVADFAEQKKQLCVREEKAEKLLSTVRQGLALTDGETALDKAKVDFENYRREVNKELKAKANELEQLAASVRQAREDIKKERESLVREKGDMKADLLATLSKEARA